MGSKVLSSTSRSCLNQNEYVRIVNPLDGLPPCANPRLIVADIHGLYNPAIKEFPPNRNGTSTVPRIYPVKLYQNARNITRAAQLRGAILHGYYIH